MKGLNWNYIALFAAVLCYTTFASPAVRVKREEDTLTLTEEVNPIAVEDAAVDGLDREKRKLPEAKFQAKNAVLGFVFSASQGSGKLGGGSSGGGLGGGLGGSFGGSVTGSPIATTTDDTPDFDRAKVSLDIPDRLFSTSFTTVTNLSKIVGDLLMNSARRTAEFVWIFQPLFGKALTVEIPTTTTESNEV